MADPQTYCSHCYHDYFNLSKTEILQIINCREMLSRIEAAPTAGVPIVNYGICSAYLKGILPRAFSPFLDYCLLKHKNSLSRRLI
ncbi:MAG TPA: hypothetical protein VN374_03245 [Desulfitobacteriaceae bacterium]|nr:hypothetical protein [Desulfitobacteriaceae bacterium]